MGNSNLHARKVLLRRYEAAAMAIERQLTEKQIMFQGGKLRALAEVLNECHHVGDDPALSGQEWEFDADRRISDALRRLQEKAQAGIQDPKDPFDAGRAFVGELIGTNGRSPF